MPRFVLGLLVVALAFSAAALAADARADSITLGFTRNTSNATEDVADQLTVEISDNGDGSVLFIVRNSGGSGVTSSITDVYWGPQGAVDALLDNTVVIDGPNTSAGVSFSNGATPQNAPGGTWVAGASADSNAPIRPNGILLNEQGGFLIARADGVTWSRIETAFRSGELQMALHVQGIGAGGQSDTFLSTTPVPEPATIALLGLGLVGVAARMRRRSRA